MKILFSDAKSQTFFQDPKKVTQKHGAQTEKKLRRRLDDLDAAYSLEDLRGAPGSWEELTAERRGQFSVRLHGPMRLVFRPEKHPPPTKPDGGLDWRAIDSVILLEIVDYHP